MPITNGESDPLAGLIERLQSVVTTAPTGRPAGKPWPFTEAAAHIGVTPKHLRYLADIGRISTIKLGKRKRAVSDREMSRICREGV